MLMITCKFGEYHPVYVEDVSITVGQLKAELEKYDDEQPIVLRHCSRHTDLFGPLKLDKIQEVNYE